MPGWHLRCNHLKEESEGDQTIHGEDGSEGAKPVWLEELARSCPSSEEKGRMEKRLSVPYATLGAKMNNDDDIITAALTRDKCLLTSARYTNYGNVKKLELFKLSFALAPR